MTMNIRPEHKNTTVILVGWSHEPQKAFNRARLIHRSAQIGFALGILLVCFKVYGIARSVPVPNPIRPCYEEAR